MCAFKGLWNNNYMKTQLSWLWIQSSHKNLDEKHEFEDVGYNLI